MSKDEAPTHDPGAEILTEISARVEAELSLLPGHLRTWVERHLTHPREISAVSDPDGAYQVRVWLVTDAGCVAFVSEGRLETFEGFTYDGEWTDVTKVLGVGEVMPLRWKS